MKPFTPEQMVRAEQMAMENHLSQMDTPLAALETLSLCLLRADKQTADPHFTTQELMEAGVFAVIHHQLSELFPYTNQQIIDSFQKLKKCPPVVLLQTQSLTGRV